MRNKFLIPVAMCVCGFGYGDNLDNSNALFDFVEAVYPEYFAPAGQPTDAILGFYARYYPATDSYLGTQGDDVYALGPALGPDVVYGGKIDQFITLQDTDITDVIFQARRPQCSYYADRTTSVVEDISRNRVFAGELNITVDNDYCVFTTNSIPNHDFNDETAWFATSVSAVDKEFRVPIDTYFAEQPTPISLEFDNAVLLNGIKVDLLAAACFGVADERIGCNDMDQPWRLDPMSPFNRFGTDRHNAHTQPDGTYHYHGNPNALFDTSGTMESPVIGFAADGFPVYGSFIQDGGEVRPVVSSYQLIAGTRPGGSDNPGGSYDGTYVDDYQYVAGSGDLDECNGMMRNGVYGYYVTDSYPWMLACFKGTPDDSFRKQTNVIGR